MSTKKSHGKTQGTDIWNLLSRRHTIAEAMFNTIMLHLRIYRECIANGAGDAEHWQELAHVTNVCGVYAKEKQNEEWLLLANEAAHALNAIGDKYDRVGGTWQSNKKQSMALTRWINVMDLDILKSMPMVDFVRISEAINETLQEKPSGQTSGKDAESGSVGEAETHQETVQAKTVHQADGSKPD